jgi:pilus assembly protein Flp/PilA
MMKLTKVFVNDKAAVTAIEYDLIASLIAIGVITAASTLGTDLSGTFNHIARNLKELSKASLHCGL